MQTRRDLYQAHKLMMQRVGLALLQGEPDIAESPMRRLSVAAFSGAMVAVLIAAIFGIIGFIHPGGARDLDKGGMIIIEKETGTKYVYNTKLKAMEPVLNYASAKLALDMDAPPQRVVSRSSLSKYTRGPLIGIQNAPDSLPDTKHLVKKPWSVCVRTDTTTNNGTRPVSSLVAGEKVGGKDIGDQAVLVKANNVFYVIWHGQRMRTTLSENQAGNVFRATPVPVSQTWINQVDEGPDFVAPLVSHPGAPKRDVAPNARVGQVYVTSENGNTYYELTSMGFARISESQKTLLLADAHTKSKAYPGQTVAPITTQLSTVNAEPTTALLNAKLPPTIPNFVSWDPTTPLCAVYAHTSDGVTSAQITTGGTVPHVADAQPQETAALDQVVLPPGGAALIGLLPGAGQLSAVNTWYIVNDAGICFQLSSQDTAKKLGYDTNDAAPLPKTILSLIPTGPLLDPKAAKLPVQTPAAKTGG